MNYASTVDYLYGLQQYGMKFGLDNIKWLLGRLGDPQHSFRTVHVAGTNGKGSTSAMIESVLRSGGVRTGLFTSPHLVSFTERIRVDGHLIPEEAVIALAGRIRQEVEQCGDRFPTFFEVATAIAFCYFREMKVAVAVAEVGMGGRLDATNVIIPEVSVITSIGADHREFLGNSLAEIAGEKAGIIKQGVPVVAAEQDAGVMDVIARKAEERGSRLYRSGADFVGEPVSSGADGNRFHYRGGHVYRDLRVPLAGSYQVMNASVAVKACEAFVERNPGFRCDVRQGLAGVVWPGRLELVRESPPVLIDGAHNPPAAEALARYLRTVIGTQYRRLILVIGVMADKDIEGILAPLLPLAAETVVCSPLCGRAAPPSLLEEHVRKLGFSARKAGSVADALNRAEGLAIPGDLVLATGSFYTIGEAKEAMGHRGALARLRE